MLRGSFFVLKRLARILISVFLKIMGELLSSHGYTVVRLAVKSGEENHRRVRKREAIGSMMVNPKPRNSNPLREDDQRNY